MSDNPLKNGCENANTIAHDGVSLGGVGTFAKEKLEARRRSQVAWIAFWTLVDCLPFDGGLSAVLGH